MEKKVYGLGEDNPHGITIESALNIGDDLPYALYKPNIEGDLSWHCGYNQEGGITSVYRMKLKEKTEYIEETFTKEYALFTRNELLKNGWQKIKPPQVKFTVGGK